MKARLAALAVADAAHDADDCRLLLDVLGLLDQAPQPKRKPGRPAFRPCGTEAAYDRGCRCEPCTGAHADHLEAERARRARRGAA